MKQVLATLGIAALVAALVGLTGIYSGIFNVAATVKDAAPLRWVLITTREASIKSHARAIQAPAPGGAKQVQNGFRIFRESCAMCHTPQGRPESTIAKGLNPQPPALADLVDMADPELFWVTKNGFRFTGMPASNASYNDQELWDVVAFMRASPKMTASDYDALDRSVPSTSPPDAAIGR